MPDPNWLLVSLFPSGIGFVFVVYGYRQRRWPQLVGGIALSVYPYFVDSIPWLIGIGIGLTAAVWGVVRAGY